MLRIGLISDTHGLLRPEAAAFLKGCDFIVHGGDIGDAGILETLRAMAPLTVVRGNNDREPWADAIAETEFLKVGGVLVYALHDLSQIDIDPAGAESAWWSRATRTSRRSRSARASSMSIRAALARADSNCQSLSPNSSSMAMR